MKSPIGNLLPLMVKTVPEKSGLPTTAAMIGVRRSFTNAVTTAPKAPPITTATARSITLPRITNFLKPFSIAFSSRYDAELMTLLQEFSQALHGRFEDRSLGGVANAHRALPAGAERHSGRQPHAGLFQQTPAKCEGIGNSRNPRKQVKRAIGLGHGHARHATQRIETQVPVRPQADRKSTRLNSSHLGISYAVFSL